MIVLALFVMLSVTVLGTKWLGRHAGKEVMGASLTNRDR